MTDDCVHFGTVALRRIVAADTDHAIAVGQPDIARMRVPAGWKAIEKPHLRRIDIAFCQGLEGAASAAAPGKFGRDHVNPRWNRALMIRIGPLHDVVVLNPN